MKHIERLAERILFLRCDATVVTAEQVKGITEVGEMLACIAAREEHSARQYNLWANDAGANADSATQRLYEDLVTDEERHGDQYATEAGNMTDYGDRYLALQAIARSKVVSMGLPGQPPA